MHDRRSPRPDPVGSRVAFRATGAYLNGGVSVTVAPDTGDSSPKDVLSGAAIEPLRDPPPRLARLLKPAEVAETLGVSRSWVYAAADNGRLPSVRLGGPDGPLRFVPEGLHRWLDEARAAWRPGGRRATQR
jgi:excisionase family DNA binding protein